MNLGGISKVILDKTNLAIREHFSFKLMEKHPDRHRLVQRNPK